MSTNRNRRIPSHQSFQISVLDLESLVSEKLARKIVPSLNLRVTREISLSFKLPGIPTRVEHTFKIVPVLPVDYILGKDFLDANQCVRDPTTNKWILRGKRILTTTVLTIPTITAE